MSERTKNNEESNETSEDHISALPDDLLLDVLSLLTADEAVQTCVLARRWRDLWRYLPSLSFVVEKPSAEAPTFRSTEHFNEFVNRLIALREPLPLVDCEIDLYQTDTSEFNNDETFPYPYLNQWIEYALTCQAQFLRVIVDDRIDQKFLLNVPLVSRHLMTLHLNNVDLLCSMDFSSCTPVLEDLEVSSCDIHARTVSSRSLKHLYIVNCHFSIGYRTLFSTPSLNSLHLAYFDGMIPLTESMPLLERAFVRLEFSSDHRYCINFAVQDCGDQSRVGCFGYPNQSVLLNGLSNAINLVLIAGPEEYIFRSDLASCCVFGKLKSLVLNEWVAIIDLDTLASVLQHSPIHERLTLRLEDSGHLVRAIGPEENYGPREQPFACTHLKVVNIECEQADEKVRKILKLLSSCGILAEQISIKKIYGFWLDRFSFEMLPE